MPCVRPHPPVNVDTTERTATLWVDAETCQLEQLIGALEDMGYVSTIRSIEAAEVESPD